MPILVLTGVQHRILEIFEKKEGEWLSITEVLAVLMDEWEKEEAPWWFPRGLYKVWTKPDYILVSFSLSSLLNRGLVSQRGQQHGALRTEWAISMLGKRLLLEIGPSSQKKKIEKNQTRG